MVLWQPNEGKHQEMSFHYQQKGGAEIYLGETMIKHTTCEKHLGIKIDQHLTFDGYVIFSIQFLMKNLIVGH